MFENFIFKPAHQPDPEKPVEFDLRPIDQATGFRMIKCFGGSGLEFEDMVSVLRHNVVGWRGISVEFSDKAKAEFLSGEFDYDHQVWIAECAQELYTRRVLTRAERKNS